MHITYENLIAKMESELKKAKAAKDHEQARGHLFAVKALAELTLEAGEGAPKEKLQIIGGPASKGSSSSMEELTEEDDGDSIFDF